MSLQFYPITKEHIKKLGAKKVDRVLYNFNDTGSGDVSGTVADPAIFGLEKAHADDKKFAFDDQFTKVGYIELNIPIINPLLAGGDYKAWSILTGLQSKDIVDIINYQMVYDKDVDDIVSLHEIRDEVFDENRFIVGPELLQKLLHERDYKKALYDYIYAKYLVKLEKLCKVHNLIDCIVEVTADNIDDIFDKQSDVEEQIAGYEIFRYNYALDLSVIQDQLLGENNRIKFELLIDAISDIVTDQYSSAPEQFNTIQLLSLAMDKEVGTGKLVENQILSYIFVEPEGYRSKIKNKHSKITDAYNQVIVKNNIIFDMQRSRDNSMYAMMNAYKALKDSISYLFIGDKNKTKRDIMYKSLTEELKGKKGFIRDQLEGARIDFSGRTVITLDPTLPIDTIGVPIEMLKKIAEPTLVKAFTTEAKSHPEWHVHGNMTDFSNQLDAGKYGISFVDFLKKFFSEHEIYGLIGRQPTLFYLGIQGFRIRPTESNAISLSPLIVMPFNADFDGDQMHFSMPLTEGGIKDVKEKMLFKDNIWYPKDGSITVQVRHEIQYGLWECVTRDFDGTKAQMIVDNQGHTNRCKTREDVYNQIIKGFIDVGADFNGKTAGRVALDYCLFGNTAQEVDLDKILKKSEKATGQYEFNAGALSKYIFAVAAGNNKEKFLSIINKVVALGFAVSKMYPPCIGVITSDKVGKYVLEKVTQFNTDLVEYKKYISIGMELEKKYNEYFTKKFEVLQNDIKQFLLDNIPDTDGYKRMVISGSKGNIDNLLQIYGFKGRVKKSDLEPFNVIINGCYAGQLTGLEHFVTAYGSRQGIADKVLSTAKPGYMSRKLEHAGALLNITTEDCSAGLKGDDVPAMEFVPEDIMRFIETKDVTASSITRPDNVSAVSWYSSPSYIKQLKESGKYLAKILVNRNVVDGDNPHLFIEDEEMAIEYINRCWGDGNPENGSKPVRMRSPMTCANSCCQICYGKDLTRNKRTPDIGKNVGFIAAQAIGEPGTQMTMKTFQKGGVVGEADLTSSFDLIESNFDMKDFTKDVTTGGVIMYDPVAPCSGYVKTINIGQGKKRVIISSDGSYNNKMNQANRDYILPEAVQVKSYVAAGEPIRRELGNVNIRDIAKYDSMEAAYKCLILKLHKIFKDEKVNCIHFECIVRNMLCYQIVTSHDRYKAGDILSFKEFNSLTDSVNAVPCLIGVKYLPKYRKDFLQSLAMESLTTYIPRAIVTSNTDDLADPIMRTAFGLDL